MDDNIKSRFKCSQQYGDNTYCKDKRNETGRCEYDYCPRKTGKPPTIDGKPITQDHASNQQGRGETIGSENSQKSNDPYGGVHRPAT